MFVGARTAMAFAVLAMTRRANAAPTIVQLLSSLNDISDARCRSLGSVLPSAIMVPLCNSVAQTALHPANVVKTLLQTKGSFGAILPLTWTTLSRGAGAQFLLSLPNGALHFAVLEVGGEW